MNNPTTPQASTLDQIALGVTMVAAVLTLVFWLWASTGAAGSGFAEAASNVTIAVTSLGGVVMGVLYLRRRLATR